MKIVPIIEIAQVIAGQSPPSSTYNYTGEGLPFFQGTADFHEKYPQPRVWCTSAKRKDALAGDILISVRAPVGTVNICNQRSIIGRGLAAIRPNSSTTSLYLYHVLKQNENNLKALSTGAIFKAITQETLKQFHIPLPQLNDQKRIAFLLESVEGLIQKRKKHLQELDTLLQSIFLEMFGDPVRNEKGWNKKILGQLLKKIESGESPKCENRNAEDDEWGVLKLGAVTTCHYISNQNKAILKGFTPRNCHEVKKGDLLFSRKNTYDLVAACAYVFETRGKLLLPDLIFRLQFKQEARVNKLFMWKLLTAVSQRKEIQALAGGSAGSMPNIGKEKLKTVELPIPPPALQDQFAAIVEKVEDIKALYQASLVELENLYGVLSQKAFKGELDLTKVSLPVTTTPFADNAQNQEVAQISQYTVEDFVKFGYNAAQFVHKLAEVIAPLIVPLLVALNAARGGYQQGIEKFHATYATSKTIPSENILVAKKKLSDGEAQQDIRDILNRFVFEELGDAPFSAQEFVDAVRQELGDITDDPKSTQELSILLYEQVKLWIFDSIKNNKLEQFFNAQENAVSFRRVGGQ